MKSFFGKLFGNRLVQYAIEKLAKAIIDIAVDFVVKFIKGVMDAHADNMANETV